MKLYVVMAQRKERYEGEYAPEALAVIAEYGNDDNPDYLRDEVAQSRASDEFTAVEIVALEVSDDALMAALFPSRKAIPATVVAAG